MKTNNEKECTLSDEELAEACRKLVHDLCQTGGQRWRMSVPVDFNNDSDMLFCELINRFKEASQFKQSSPEGEGEREQVAKILRDNITFSGQVGDYIIHGAIEKIIEWANSRVPSPPKSEQPN